MSREIKFRAWDCHEMHYNVVPTGSREVMDIASPCIYRKVDNIMQFTGLKDKNGVEIYEGDVVRHLIYEFHDVKQVYKPTYDKNELVTFKDGAFCLDDSFASFGNMGHTYEVIGDIHQHPHLLNK